MPEYRSLLPFPVLALGGARVSLQMYCFPSTLLVLTSLVNPSGQSSDSTSIV